MTYIKRLILMWILGRKTTYRVSRTRVLISGKEVASKNSHYGVSLVQKGKMLGTIMIVQESDSEFVGNFLVLEKR